jgi:hypothetical protein
MLFLIIFYILVSSICFWAGLVFYTLIPEEKGNQEIPKQRPLISYLITGLIVLTTIGQWLALFLPLRLPALLVILVALGILSFYNRRIIGNIAKKIWLGQQQSGSLHYFCLFCFLLMILILNAGPTIMDDTDSYHIQMVKWLQDYGTVKGIANLHLRFGFNSSWFTSIGLLSPNLNGINSYCSLNGLISLWLCHYLLEKIFDLFSGSNPGRINNSLLAYLLILFFCLINWPLIRGNAESANYDFITTCCVLILFLENGFLSKSKSQVEWLIWPFYLFTVRIINYPLLLFGILEFLALYKSRKILSNAFYVLTGILMISPFIIRNTLLSGYPFFPSGQFDFLSFDWKADKQGLIEINEYIKYFNRINPGRIPMMITSQYKFPGWILQWFKYQTINDKIIMALSLSGYGLLLIFWKRFRQHLIFNKYLIGILILQLISWFCIAPDPRFVYGPLLIGICAIPFAFPFSAFSLNFSSLRLTLVVMASVVLVYSFSKPWTDLRYRNWLAPATLPVAPVRVVSIDGIDLHIPEKVLNNWNPRCYDITLPCLYRMDPRLKARGKTIQEGFKLDKSHFPVSPDGEYKIKW